MQGKFLTCFVMWVNRVKIGATPCNHTNGLVESYKLQRIIISPSKLSKRWCSWLGSLVYPNTRLNLITSCRSSISICSSSLRVSFIRRVFSEAWLKALNRPSIRLLSNFSIIHCRCKAVPTNSSAKATQYIDSKRTSLLTAQTSMNKQLRS